MARDSSSYFTFKGLKSTDMGVRLRSYPEIPSPVERGEELEAAGRDGDYWLADNSNDVVKLKIQFEVLDDINTLRTVRAWLTGSGRLSFSDLEGQEYVARLGTTGTTFTRMCVGRLLGTVNFVLQPYAYIVPEAEDITIITTAAIIENQGTVSAYPKITIEGNGDFSLTIGSTTIFLEGVEDGIVIDSELMDALNLDENMLLNSKVGGDFPIIPTGTSYVSWVLEDGASISKVTIKPRWRVI